MPNVPIYDDVAAAARRIEGHAHRTPVMRSATLDQVAGAAFFFKCENFQRVGAFKFRGAFNALSRFTDAQKRAGVIAFSSGNHAQAVALSAKLLGIAATIVMPTDAPAGKMAATRGYGASIVTYDRYSEDREAIGDRLAKKTGATLNSALRPSRHRRGAGNGGQGVVRGGRRPRRAVRLSGGGGLLAGSALAAKALSPACRIYGVEPEAGNDGQQSLRAGHIVKIDTPKTIADGAQTWALGDITFEIIRRDVDDILTASDAELVECMRFFASRMKIIAEPTGCLGLAGARQLASQFPGGRIGVIISGGNIDLGRFCELVATGTQG